MRPWQERLHEVIYEADTPLGRAFDVGLIVCILASVAAVMLDSVAAIRAERQAELQALEWGFTVLFTIEYGLRLVCVQRPTAYARSFYGVVDLLAVLPTYISLLVPGAHYLLVIRIVRILRVFRVLKLARHVREARLLSDALRASSRKIFVFLYTVLTLVTVLGALMYLLEGPEAGFTSIPRSIYWAIVTLTTVGYGDIHPLTPAGQLLAAVVMILGYSIIAVPTGIVTVELSRPQSRGVSTQACRSCSAEGHDPDARFCKFCGEQL
jgi:voltage-gated potassium channel